MTEKRELRWRPDRSRISVAREWIANAQTATENEAVIYAMDMTAAMDTGDYVPPNAPSCPCPHCEKAYSDGYLRGVYDAEGGEEKREPVR